VSQLQPTYFYRNPDTLLNCISTLTKHREAEALITVKKIEDTAHPDFIGRINNEGYLSCKSGDVFRRQDLPPRYAYFGSVMIAKTDYFLKEKTFYTKNLLPFIIDDQLEALDINTEFDMQIANAVIALKNKDK
jgi:CMP-N-acetylneuraminic acid synthetase